MSISEKARIITVPDVQALATTAAEFFAQAATKNIAAHGRFTVALSGGSTPKAVFALLAAEPYQTALDWAKIYFFWGDERCVPPDHQDSNYRMTKENLLAKVPVPEANIFRMAGEKEPAAAAQEYAAQLKAFFQTDALPKFDVILLGMGADGHTASLFPGTTALQVVANLIAVENYVEKLNTFRITLTAATINNASEIIFLVGGSDKAETLKNVLQGTYQPEIYPSQLIQPQSGKLIWMVDESAYAQCQ